MGKSEVVFLALWFACLGWLALAMPERETDSLENAFDLVWTVGILYLGYSIGQRQNSKV
jgi:hypothetical protein